MGADEVRFGVTRERWIVGNPYRTHIGKGD